ncbi:MAG: histidinol dehydrogenase, partial [Dehalococcoidales bacterium]|nr:histidinol dehydrogenase [Dehalococcoidales bacterium]
MKIIEGFQSVREALSRRAAKETPDALAREQSVRQIIDDVRRQGDAALFDYTLKFDGVSLTSLEVSKEAVSNAHKHVDAGLVSALKLASERICSFHTAQKKALGDGFSQNGLRQLVRPLERVGVYVPGGTARYPSTVLMT